MAPFTVADLKSKAVKAKDAGVSKLSTTRDRMQSTPSAQTGFDPYAKRTPPPPPPLRSAGSSSSASASGAARPPPPPVRRTSRPDAAPPPAPPRRSPPTVVHSSSSAARAYGGEQRREPGDRVDWAHLSAADKQALFGWLDEFFSRYLGRAVGPLNAGAHSHSHSHSTPGLAGSETLSASWRRTLPPPLAPLAGPPKPNLSTKPLSASFENM